jgi:hypothetical protein
MKTNELTQEQIKKLADDTLMRIEAIEKLLNSGNYSKFDVIDWHDYLDIYKNLVNQIEV